MLVSLERSTEYRQRFSSEPVLKCLLRIVKWVSVTDQVGHLAEHVSHAVLDLFIGWGTTGRKTELVDRSLQVGLPSAQQPVLGGGLRMQ